MFALIRDLKLAGAAVAALCLVVSVRAEIPYPKSDSSMNPRDYSSYLFLGEGMLPNDYSDAAPDAWKYRPATGMNILGAWRFTTGRPDVVSGRAGQRNPVGQR